MISFVSSVCPAPNLERDRDLIRSFKKGKKQKSKLKKETIIIVKNFCSKFTYCLLLLEVRPVTWLKNNKLETRQTKSLLISFKIFW